MIKFPREEKETDWIISVSFLKNLKTKIDDQYLPHLDLEDIEAVLLALEEDQPITFEHYRQ